MKNLTPKTLFQLYHTTTKTSFYIGGKPASTTGPTPSLFQVSLYVDNNDIGQLAPVFVMEKNNVSG